MRRDAHYARLAASSDLVLAQVRREDAARHVQEFLAKGGKIQQVPIGKSGWPTSKGSPSDA